MYNRAGRINVGKLDKDGKLKNDENVQKFENLPFRIKVETLPKEENSARIFLKEHEDEEIPIPHGITCVDITFKKKYIKKDPVVPGVNWFLITHPYKYNIYYDPKKNRTKLNYKIYSLNAGKDYTIYNYKKTTQILENEKYNRMAKKNKVLDDSINTITGLNLNDSENDDETDDDDMNN
jgi:hypothetical protein